MSDAKKECAWAALVMLDEIGKFLLHDLLGECLSGLLLRSRSSKARRLKFIGWMCVFASIACFFSVALWRPVLHPGLYVVAGLLGVVALGFGFVASVISLGVVNAKLEVDPSVSRARPSSSNDV